MVYAVAFILAAVCVALILTGKATPAFGPIR